MAGLGGLHSGLNGLLVARQSEVWGSKEARSRTGLPRR